MRKLISTQALFTGAVAILALLVFNLTRPALESDLLVSFNDWYATTAPKLEQADPAALSTVKLSVTVGLAGRPTPPPNLSWTLPVRSLAEQADRENTARVLQLVHESGIFAQRPIKLVHDGGSYLSISVRDGERRFETTVPASEIEKSIQLQNLLKLLEIFSKASEGLEIQPSRT